VGVSIVDEADDNTIGGATPADANVISGNSGSGSTSRVPAARSSPVRRA
jgi:hypothetical protein